MNQSGFTIVFGGPDFQPEEFLRDSRLEPSVVHRGGAVDESWLEFSDIHDGTYPLSVATEALDFLQSHHDEFVRLSRYPGIVTRTLNFFGDAASCSIELRPADIALLHELSVHVSVGVYFYSTGIA